MANFDDITEDVAKLRVLADHVDPAVTATPLDAADMAEVADDLRRIAAHLHRIATGGHRPAPEGLTAEPMSYDAEPPA